MKVRTSQMALPDRAVADSMVLELAEDAPETSGFLQTTVAAIKETSSLRGWLGLDNADHDYQSIDAPDNYNPLDDVPEEMFNSGVLDHAWEEIIASKNTVQTTDILTNANASAKRREIMENGSGWANFWGTTIGIISSPEYWPGLIWNPSGGVLKSAAQLGMIGTAETAAHEYSLQKFQPGRDPYESFANVGLAAVFATGIGGAVGAATRKSIKGAAKEIGAEVDDIAHNQGFRNIESLPDEIPVWTPTPFAQRSVGAAEAAMGENAMPIRGFRFGGKFISALRPLAKARLPVVHETLNKYFGHDFQIAANAKKVKTWNPETKRMEETGQVEHEAKLPSLARRVDRESAVFTVKAERIIREGFINYTGHQGKTMTMARISNRGKYQEFNEKVRWAMSNNDQAANADDVAVTNTAKALREAVYAPIEKLAREAEMLDQQAREAIKSRITTIGDKIRASEDAVEIRMLNEQMEQAQKELDLFSERIGEVKFAESYANRRYIRDAIEDQSVQFRERLAARYKEIREADAYKAQMDAWREGINSRLEKIAKRTAKLTKQKKAVKSDKTLLRWQKEIDDIDTKMKLATEDDFRITSQEGLSDIQSNAYNTYRKLLNGELIGEVWQKGAHNPKTLKERQLPLTDNELLEMKVLHTDMLDNVKNYVRSTLRPIRMKEVAGDTEMAEVLKNVEDSYKAAITKTTSDELRKSLEKEATVNVEALELARDRYYGRSIQRHGAAASVANVWRGLRNLNIMRMMGGVLFTSMNDLARLNAGRIYATSFEGGTPGLWSAWRTYKNAATREGMKMSGIAHETVDQIRLTRYVDLGVPEMSGNRLSKAFLNLTARGAKALMKATLLSQWTDFMKMMAAAMVQNQTIRLARNYSKLNKRQKTILAEMGIDEQFAAELTQQFDQYGTRIGKYGTSLNWDDWDDQVLAERMKDIMFRQSERILVTPRETDLPMVLSESEMGRSFLQFKSFSLAAHNQTTVPLIERAQSKDLMAYYAIATMSIGAVPLEMLKMYEAGREDELRKYSPADWGLAIADRSAIIPLVSMGFNMIDMTSGNALTSLMGAQPTSRYSDRTILGAFGPTFSTVGDMARLTSGISDGLDSRDARAVRRLAPFQNYFLLNRLATELLPKQKRRTKGQKMSEK